MQRYLNPNTYYQPRRTDLVRQIESEETATDNQAWSDDSETDRLS